MCSAAAMVLPVGALTTVMPGPRRRLEVDVVDADAGPADDLQPRPGGEELGIDLDLAADDERVVVADRGAELVGREPGPLVDVVGGRGARARPSSAIGSATRILMPRRRPGRAPVAATAERGRPAARGRRPTPRARPGGPTSTRAGLERRDRAEDLVDGHRAEVAETEDLAGELALAAGEDHAAPLDLAVEGLPVEALGDPGRGHGVGR